MIQDGLIMMGHHSIHQYRICRAVYIYKEQSATGLHYEAAVGFSKR